eukprot:TRINITY_DN3455_c0_g1_i12.p1 TRINITY_DN3455_c0_g1~~TRINITY_DN3455_c0_g1_i12.p1  ORF type:complete len:185 (+),score=24.31 TRINITY_DN3455_c0_g1_i12:669-1223(+)
MKFWTPRARRIPGRTKRGPGMLPYRNDYDFYFEKEEKKTKFENGKCTVIFGDIPISILRNRTIGPPFVFKLNQDAKPGRDGRINFFSLFTSYPICTDCYDLDGRRKTRSSSTTLSSSSYDDTSSSEGTVESNFIVERKKRSSSTSCDTTCEDETSSSENCEMSSSSTSSDDKTSFSHGCWWVCK